MKKQIYSVNGTLSKGFVGQIAYTVCLDRTYHTLDAGLSFDKRVLPAITEEVKEEVRQQVKELYGGEYSSDEELTDACSSMKTEIQLLVNQNDIFIGGIHRQLTDRHMIISKNFATEGGIPQDEISGVIKIIVLVFNVLQDDTHYTVTLSVDEEEAVC